MFSLFHLIQEHACQMPTFPDEKKTFEANCHLAEDEAGCSKSVKQKNNSGNKPFAFGCYHDICPTSQHLFDSLGSGGIL